MSRYTVMYTEGVKKVTIEAEDASEANDMFREMIPNFVTIELINEDEPDARLSVYTCTHCGITDLKTRWGAGRITCPDCKKIA